MQALGHPVGFKFTGDLRSQGHHGGPKGAMFESRELDGLFHFRMIYIGAVTARDTENDFDKLCKEAQNVGNRQFCLKSLARKWDWQAFKFNVNDPNHKVTLPRSKCRLILRQTAPKPGSWREKRLAGNTDPSVPTRDKVFKHPEFDVKNSPNGDTTFLTTSPLLGTAERASRAARI
ncbi:hypothetical protein Bbelb_007570 [Branchiostoma belcheri]|nr:hypothetical protein Bbelb_007570 [Branchiostoma belcheri]